jgi:small GTP-binding protein
LFRTKVSSHWSRIGDSSVGKTTIANCFIENSDEHPTATVTFNDAGLDIPIDGKTHAFDIWDTAGREHYHSLIPRYVRGAGGALVVFDVTVEESFSHLPDWHRILQESAEPLIFVFGNKTDLADQRLVPLSTAQEFCTSAACEYLEGSGRTGVGIHSALETLT